MRADGALDVISQLRMPTARSALIQVSFPVTAYPSHRKPWSRLSSPHQTRPPRAPTSPVSRPSTHLVPISSPSARMSILFPRVARKRRTGTHTNQKSVALSIGSMSLV